MECSSFQMFTFTNKTCRSCLSNHERLHGIPVEMYTFCTSLTVKQEDDLPNNLCQACFDILNNFYYFKLQCIRSDSILRQQIINEVTKDTATKVITENQMIKADSKVSYYELDSKAGATLMPSNKETIELKNATEIVNTKQADGFGNSVKRFKNVLKKRDTKLLYCQKCDKTFYKYVKLEAHMRKHFGLKPDSVIKCSHCDKTFTTEKNLKSHLRVHSGERKYKCKLCGKSFAYSNVLKNHERAHAGIKKYVCQQCGKKFVQLTNLNTHMQLHTGEKPYSCGNCGRSFRQISELKMHLLRHSGVKDYACHICSLRFYTNFSLRKHMGVHSDIRPFACNVCDKRFKSQSYLVVHQRTHTGERPFNCDFCSLTFISAKDRRNHRKIHTEEKSKLNKTVQTNQDNIKKILAEPQQHHAISTLNVNTQIEERIPEYIPNAHHSISELTPLKPPIKIHCSYSDGNLVHERYEQFEKSQSNYLQPNLENKTCSFVGNIY